MEVELKFLEIKATTSKGIIYKGDLHMNLIGNNLNISINLFSSVNSKKSFNFQIPNSILKFGLFQGKVFLGIGKINITNETKWITIKCQKSSKDNLEINLNKPSEIKIKVKCKIVKIIEKNSITSYNKYIVKSSEVKRKINRSMDFNEDSSKKINNYNHKKNLSMNKVSNIYNKEQMKLFNKSVQNSIENDSMLINDIITLSNDSNNEYSYIQLNNTKRFIFQNEIEQLEKNLKLNYSEDKEIESSFKNLNFEFYFEKFISLKNKCQIPNFKRIKTNNNIEYKEFIKKIFKLFKLYYFMWIELNKQNKLFTNYIKNYSDKIVQLKKKKCKLGIIREKERLSDELIFMEYGYSDYNHKINNLNQEMNIWQNLCDNLSKDNNFKKRKNFLNERLKYLFKFKNKSFDLLNQKQKDFILKLIRKHLGNNILKLTSLMVNKNNNFISKENKSFSSEKKTVNNEMDKNNINNSDIKVKKNQPIKNHKNSSLPKYSLNNIQEKKKFPISKQIKKNKIKPFQMIETNK